MCVCEDVDCWVIVTSILEVKLFTVCVNSWVVLSHICVVM